MNELFNGIVIGIIVAVVSGILVFFRINFEYKRRLIHERTKDFFDELKCYYKPFGYYSALLALSSSNLSSDLNNDYLIKRMLFDLGNYIHRFLELSEKIGYAAFPIYTRKFEIFAYHIKIQRAFNNLLDPIAISILRNISIKCNNNYEKFSNEIDKSEVLKIFKDNLAKNSLNEIAINPTFRTY
jgi:hypothetical protein